jgi:YesN/AraC family two-component response regulator
MTLLTETRFDIVLTDLRMPGVDGLTLIRWVRERVPDMALIVASGFAEAQEETEVRSLGAVLLFKPFGRLELKQALTDALAQSAWPQRV